MPSVHEITAAALSDDWYLHSNGRFCPGANPNPLITDEITPVVKDFLKKVADCAADYRAELARPRAAIRPHYEDLFSLAEQAARAETDHVPNLATVEFLRRLRLESAPLHCGFKGGSLGGEGLVGLAFAACEFLHWVVDSKLRSAGKCRRGLDAISKTALAVDALDVFTLNHDTLVENQLAADGIHDIETGFEDRTHGQFSVYRSRWWKCTATPRKHVRLFKLHGSLDWWLFDFPGWARQYAIPDGEPDRGKDERGQLVDLVEWKAAFLSGTIVKELRYGLGFWGEQIEGFREHLAAHTTLICCGYGFGDAGVNLRIDQWMCDRLDGSNRLVILTPDAPERYLSDKPHWLIRHFEAGRVHFVPKYFNNCEVSDLRRYFDPL